MNVTFNLSFFQANAWIVSPAPEEEAALAAQRRALRPTPRREPARVLIVHADDNERDVLRRLLEARNFSVYEARSGPQALEIASGVRPDIVLLVTPGRAGADIVRALRSAFDMRTLPVIVIAACIELAVLEECLAAGASDFALKPVDWSELHLRMRIHLARAESSPKALAEHVAEIWA